MFVRSSLLPCITLLWLAGLGGCRSVLNLPPDPGPRGGFTVLAGLPDQPNAVRVFKDVGTFAVQRGFMRESAPAAAQTDPATQQPVPSGPERYQRDKLKLDLSYDPAHLRVVAYLHSPPGNNGDRRFISQFDRDFHQAYAGSYGGDGSVVEDSFSDEASLPARGGGSRGDRPGGGSPGGGGH